ncbi:MULTISPECIES: D-alanyl-D-alanine carboxypeptidase family protein [Trichocoleus]|uniref:D-alanyl-D-alanine carboxypeptidase family protein n=1 Tax=Trichocoleus desertorum GB2-A4 TaxID=2933944 RepID=A0ABV0JEJ5_9CYAN|nr:D-alanyl-D-alanine carboxypeptidase family protein [Trichocoleus sp. FACHB-46]MBD1862401.1 D-alanyl-D-alanine carboxypeptidase family protein [Trichocoleus sp. FACHB-46]
MALVKEITGCETSPVRSLDQQLIDEVNVIIPNVLVSIEDLNVELTGSSVWTLLQLPAKEALGRAIAERGEILQINSGYRPLAGQLVLFQNASECGYEVAPVGSSDHQSGLALDIEDNEGWRPYLERHGWKWFGPADDVHFDFEGQDIGNTAILAFQQLWNRNNPNDPIPEDGIYGDQTEIRLGNSPAEGFPPPVNGGLPLEPGTYFLKCLGDVEGPRWLDGRTGDGTVGLAPNTDPPYTGIKWEVTFDEAASAYRFKCLGDVEGPRWLDGRTGDGTVGLAPNTDPPYTGIKWEVTFDEAASAYRFKCLGDVEGPRWLDGRTGDGTVGLAPNTDPPYTGTKWQVEPAVIPENPNAILYELTPTGASAETAESDGLPGGGESSRKMAETDAPKVLRFVERFQVAGREYNLPPALLAAIASRESRGGSALNDCLGDGGAGVGIMQVDQTVRPPAEVTDPGPDCASQEHINQAASILRGFVDQAAAAHPEWSAAIQLQAGTASYNAGPDQIEVPDFDEGTTGGDYSNDVIARAQYYADNWRSPAAVV